MGKRQQTMAVINAALQNPAPTGGEASSTTATVVAPHPAPGVDAPTVITAEEQAKKAQKEVWEQSERNADAQAAAFQSELDEEQQQADLFTSSANSATNAARNIVRGTGIRLERLPTPGSIVLPLIILLVFFFLLLPVNGHTRLVWLWLVITGNADIQPGKQEATTASSLNAGRGDSSSDTGNTTPGGQEIASNLGGAAGSSFGLGPITGINIGSIMTGVEDL